MAVCQKCGKDNPPSSSVCSECGTAFPRKKPNLAGTMLGMPTPAPPQQDEPPNQQPAPGPTTANPSPSGPKKPALGGTMLGMPSPVAPAEHAPPATEPQPAAPAKKGRALGGTMLGMGVPSAPPPARPADAGHPVGTPTASDNPPAFAASEPKASESDDVRSPPAAAKNPKFKGTLLGVAQPGIAPSSLDPPAPPGSAPTPAPPPLESQPVPQPFPTSRPVWQSAAFIGGAMAIAASIGAIFAIMAGDPIVVRVQEFSIDEQGSDQLLLRCEACPDGSTLLLGEASATVEDQQAKLSPQEPLELGRNELDFKLQHDGEIENVKKVILPIAFRVLTEWSGMHADVPYAEISVAAPSGSRVTIDGDPIEVKDERGVKRIAFAKKTTGESPTVERIESSIDVSVLVDEETRSTKAEIRGGVAPLTLTSPARVHVLGGKPLAVSGRTAPEAKVSIGDQETTADDKGRFSHIVESPKPGSLRVRAWTDELVARTVELELTSEIETPDSAVTSFKELEAGKMVRLTANVIESRTAAGTTRALLEVESGCENPPCLLRAIYGEPRKLAPNRKVRVVGLVSGGSPLTVRVRHFE